MDWGTPSRYGPFSFLIRLQECSLRLEKPLRGILLSTLMLSALATAQAGHPDPATIHVTSRIVYVDVIVRDSSGRIVHGLTQNDLRVLVDGKPQKALYI